MSNPSKPVQCTSSQTSSRQASCFTAGQCPWPCAFDPAQFPLVINGTVLPGAGMPGPMAPGLTYAGIRDQVPYANLPAKVQLNDIFTIVSNFSHASNNNNYTPWAGILVVDNTSSAGLPIVCNTATRVQKGTGAPTPMLFTLCRAPGPVDSMLIMPTNPQLAAVAPLMQCAMGSDNKAQYTAFVSGANPTTTGGTAAAPVKLAHGLAVCNSYSPPHVYVLYSDDSVIPQTGPLPPNTLAASAIQTNSILENGAYWSVYAANTTGYVTMDAANPTSCACTLPPDSYSSQCILGTDDEFEWAYAVQLNLQFRATFIQLNQLTFVDMSTGTRIRWNGRLQYVAAWGCECGTPPLSTSQCYTGSTGGIPNTSSTCFSSSCTAPCVPNPLSLAPYREYTDLNYGESATLYQALYGDTYMTVYWAPASQADALAASTNGQAPYTLTYFVPARYYVAPGVSALMSKETDPILAAQRVMYLDVRNTDSGGSNVYFWTASKPGSTSSEANPPTNTLSKESGLFGRNGSGHLSTWGIIGISLLVVIGVVIAIIILGLVLRYKTSVNMAKAAAAAATAASAYSPAVPQAPANRTSMQTTASQRNTQTLPFTKRR